VSPCFRANVCFLQIEKELFQMRKLIAIVAILNVLVSGYAIALTETEYKDHWGGISMSSTNEIMTDINYYKRHSTSALEPSVKMVFADMDGIDIVYHQVTCMSVLDEAQFGILSVFVIKVENEIEYGPVNTLPPQPVMVPGDGGLTMLRRIMPSEQGEIWTIAIQTTYPFGAPWFSSGGVLMIPDEDGEGKKYPYGITIQRDSYYNGTNNQDRLF